MAGKTHVVLKGSNRAKDPTATPVGELDPNDQIDLTIGLVGPQLPGPDEYVGQTLSPAEFAKRFGSNQADADKVAKCLEKYGLKVLDVSLANRSMRVIGSAADIQKAFRSDMMIMRSPLGVEYRGRHGTIQIPAELKGLVTGVFGLDERRMARRKARSATAPRRLKRSALSATLSPLTPADLEQRYNFPPGDGTGQSIAIAEFGGGYFADDVTTFATKFQRPVPSVSAVPVDAPAYTLQQIYALPPDQRNDQLGNSIEVMMDVEIIAGLCPRANISVYFSTFDQQGWIDLLNAVISANPVVLSVSWGLAEDDPGWSANARTAINNQLNTARLLGITICVSSGDDGSGDQIDDGHAHVDFPSSSPFVLSVGGTMLDASAGPIAEVVWWQSPGRRTNAGGGSTGGGVSTIFDRPAWQTVSVKSLNAGSIDGRVIPDVVALSGPPYYDLIFIGQPQPNGGTSASAPLWAALVARIDAALPAAKRHRFLTPLLYQAGTSGQPIGQTALVDITSGNNASNPEPGVGYAAGPGFDAASGWGVPDGVKLLNALKAV